MRVLVCGDTHGSFDILGRVTRTKEPDLVLQAGDFGYWPRRPWVSKLLHKLAPAAPIHFCDGNHEDHHALNNLRWGGRYGSPQPEGWAEPPRAWRVAPGVFWQERGSTLTLPDGRVVLFAGGAWSIDWSNRTQGSDWFEQEELLSEWDLARFPEGTVDIVVSHTCPTLFREWKPSPEMPFDARPDPSQALLDLVLERYKPSLWFFGHFHRALSGTVDGCEWHSLGPMDGATERLSDGCFVLE